MYGHFSFMLSFTTYFMYNRGDLNMKRFVVICIWIVTFSVGTVSESNEGGHDMQLTRDPLTRQIFERLKVLEARTNSQQLPLSEHALMRQLFERVSVLEAHEKKLLGRVSVLEARDKKLLEHMNVLEARNNNQQQEIDKLKLELTSQKQDMTRMRSQVIEKECNESKSKRADVPVHHQSNATNSKLSRKFQENRIRRSETEVLVAFTAGLSHSILHAGEHQNIVFDHVETNIGNAYNPHHGVFIAPVTGTYMFYTSIMSESNREICGQIVVNGVSKVTAYARGTDNRFDQGSQVVIVHLQQGDDVAVQNYLADDGIFSNQDFWTTFSGFLLCQG